MKQLSRGPWERFLADGDEAAFLAQISDAPTLIARIEAMYPEFHRLCDVRLQGHAFRIFRLFERGVGQESLFVEATDVPDCQNPGVPYWLQGARLSAWIEDEIEAPTNDDVDWSRYAPDLATLAARGTKRLA